MDTHFNDAIGGFLEYQKNKNNFSEDAMTTYSINILNFFTNIYSPNGYYYKILKPKLSKSWGKNNECKDLKFYGFLLSFSHCIVKNLILDKRNLTKDTIMDKINLSVFWLNGLAKENFKITNIEHKGIAEKVINNYMSDNLILKTNIGFKRK